MVTYYINYFSENNIALGKPAFQSTTGYGGIPDR